MLTPYGSEPFCQILYKDFLKSEIIHKDCCGNYIDDRIDGADFMKMNLLHGKTVSL